MKTPGGWNNPGRRAPKSVTCLTERFRAKWSPVRVKKTRQKKSLEHSEHDRADKCECNVRGNNAQLADESHGKPPWFTSQVVVTRKLASGSRLKKSALLHYRGTVPAADIRDVVKKA